MVVSACDWVTSLLTVTHSPTRAQTTGLLAANPHSFFFLISSSCHRPEHVVELLADDTGTNEER